jgi:hypothetical protein
VGESELIELVELALEQSDVREPGFVFRDEGRRGGKGQGIFDNLRIPGSAEQDADRRTLVGQLTTAQNHQVMGPLQLSQQCCDFLAIPVGLEKLANPKEAGASETPEIGMTPLKIGCQLSDYALTGNSTSMRRLRVAGVIAPPASPARS